MDGGMSALRPKDSRKCVCIFTKCMCVGIEVRGELHIDWNHHFQAFGFVRIAVSDNKNYRGGGVRTWIGLLDFVVVLYPVAQTELSCV